MPVLILSRYSRSFPYHNPYIHQLVKSRLSVEVRRKTLESDAESAQDVSAAKFKSWLVFLSETDRWSRTTEPVHERRAKSIEDLGSS